MQQKIDNQKKKKTRYLANLTIISFMDKISYRLPDSISDKVLF